MTPALLGADAITPVATALAESPRVAVDTEFHPERRRRPLLYVVSLATEAGEVFLVDGTDAAALSALREPLADKPWVLHAARMDLPLLEPFVGRPAELVDTQLLGGLCSPLYPARLEQLLADDPGAARVPAQTMSDWSRRPLTEAQRAYAASDVAGLLALADRLLGRIADLGRLGLVAPATAELLDALWDPSPSWRTLRGAEHLDSVGAAIVDELLHFREGLAREADSPAGAILADGHVLDLAKRRPITPEAVGRNRRFPRRFAQSHGVAIAELVQRVLRRPPELLPKTHPAGSPREAEAAWWWAQALLAGQREQWAAPLWLTPDLLDALVADQPVEGWRASVLEPWRRGLRDAFAAVRRRDPDSAPR